MNKAGEDFAKQEKVLNDLGTQIQNEIKKKGARKGRTLTSFSSNMIMLFDNRILMSVRFLLVIHKMSGGSLIWRSISPNMSCRIIHQTNLGMITKSLSRVQA